ILERRNNAGSSRTPSHPARRTRTIWQCWPVPALSGLLPPTPAPSGAGCPQLHRPATTGSAVAVSHLHSNISASWRTDAGIKLSAVATDISGVSGRAMLEALIAGQRDPAVLAELAKRRLRHKIAELTEALTGRFGEHHAFLARLHLDLIDSYTRAVDDLTGRIEAAIEPFRTVRDLLVTVPGISTGVADVIIAETGADMTRFPTPEHLASWAGTCPGSNESAGRIKSTKTRPANPYLKGALGVAALSAVRAHNTYLAAKYRRIAVRRGPQKALVAVEHCMLTAIWHMLTNGVPYAELGGDFYIRHNPDKIKSRAIEQLRQLGYAVTLGPLPSA